MYRMEKEKRIHSMSAALLAYLCNLLLGSCVIIINATLVPLSEAYAVDIARASLLISCLGVGRVITQTVCGALTDRLGRKLIFISGLCIMLVFFIALPISRSFALSAGLCVLAGVGYGMLNTSSLASIYDCFAPTGRNAAAQNFVQVLYSMGGILTPFIANRLLNTGVAWGNLYWFWAAFAAAAIVAALCIKFPPVFKKEAAQCGFKMHPRLMREGLILCLAVFFVYSMGIVSTTWLPMLAVERIAFTKTQAVLVLAIYNTGCLLGTAAFILLLKKVHARRFLILNPMIAMCGIALCMLTNLPALFLLGVFLAGSVIAIIFNMGIGIGSELFGTKAGTIIGMIATTSSISTLLIPAVTGWLLSASNIQTVFLSEFVFGALAVVFALILAERYKKLRDA